MANYFSTNLKFLRENKKISQNKLAEIVGVNQTTIARWETEEIKPSIDNVEEVAKALNVQLPDLLIKDLRFDNAEIVIESETIQIPVLGTIKAGVAIEAQQDILEYVDIPKSWLTGNKNYYGLKISGDSMYPKYCENDIVIFEQTNGIDIIFNKKDCAIMVNGYDATFKNVTINENGITLVPLNLNNQDNYQPTFYNKEQIEQLPVKIIGIAKEKRTKIN